MKNVDVVRAWKDVDYRSALSASELQTLPQNPAGAIEVSDLDAANVAGATTLPCVAIATAALSCWPACNSTAWDGTCGMFSVGCCGS